SSMSTFNDYCQQKYFLVYNLGLKDRENVKTVKGTIVHGCLEILAGMKNSFQDNGRYEYTHEGIGLYSCSNDKFLEKHTLTNEEVDKVNKSRINKQIYMDQIKVEYGLTRYGIEVVEDVLDKCFNYYSSKSGHDWSRADKRD